MNLEHTFNEERLCAGEQEQISAAVSSHTATKTLYKAQICHNIVYCKGKKRIQHTLM